MKKMAFILLSTSLIAAPAWALKITNLDKVPHRVELSGNGAPQVMDIAPDATEYFIGAAHGFLALKDGPVKPKKPAHDSMVHADGMLSGIIGNEREAEIPADPDNNYAIWPGGKLRVQSRIKHSEGR